MVDQRSVGDADGFSDRAQAGPVRTALSEDLDRAAEDLLLPSVSLGVAAALLRFRWAFVHGDSL